MPKHTEETDLLAVLESTIEWLKTCKCYEYGTINDVRYYPKEVIANLRQVIEKAKGGE